MIASADATATGAASNVSFLREAFPLARDICELQSS